jgi:hypothetical protein
MPSLRAAGVRFRTSNRVRKGEGQARTAPACLFELPAAHSARFLPFVLLFDRLSSSPGFPSHPRFPELPGSTGECAVVCRNLVLDGGQSVDDQAASLPCVDSAERSREHHGHSHPPKTECHRVGAVPRIEVADSCHQQVTNHKIERSPEDVDRRRRGSLAWRRGKWARKGASGHPVREVRHRVREERTTEKVSDIVVPAHRVPRMYAEVHRT